MAEESEDLLVCFLEIRVSYQHGNCWDSVIDPSLEMVRNFFSSGRGFRGVGATVKRKT